MTRAGAAAAAAAAAAAGSLWTNPPAALRCINAGGWTCRMPLQPVTRGWSIEVIRRQLSWHHEHWWGPPVCRRPGHVLAFIQPQGSTCIAPCGSGTPYYTQQPPPRSNWCSAGRPGKQGLDSGCYWPPALSPHSLWLLRATSGPSNPPRLPPSLCGWRWRCINAGAV